jgi:hypothetical protein
MAGFTPNVLPSPCGHMSEEPEAVMAIEAAMMPLMQPA